MGAKLGKRDFERIFLFTCKWMAINFIEKKPSESKIIVHMKHFSVLIRPFKSSVVTAKRVNCVFLTSFAFCVFP